MITQNAKVKTQNYKSKFKNINFYLLTLLVFAFIIKNLKMKYKEARNKSVTESDVICGFCFYRAFVVNYLGGINERYQNSALG